MLDVALAVWGHRSTKLISSTQFIQEFQRTEVTLSRFFKIAVPKIIHYIFFRLKNKQALAPSALPQDPRIKAQSQLTSSHLLELKPIAILMRKFAAKMREANSAVCFRHSFHGNFNLALQPTS
jgi:hypothetical protein